MILSRISGPLSANLSPFQTQRCSFTHINDVALNDTGGASGTNCNVDKQFRQSERPWYVEKTCRRSGKSILSKVCGMSDLSR